LRNVLYRAADYIIVRVGAVNRYVPAAAELTGGRDDDGVCFSRIEIRRGTVSRDQQSELEEITAIERQALDFALHNETIDNGVTVVDQRRPLDDGVTREGCRVNLHLQVKGNGLAHV